MKLREILELVLIITIMGVGYILLINKIDSDNERKEQLEIKQYTKCINEQSKEHDYIIRSYCSDNYEYLDNKANIQYKQINNDLYLK